MANPKPSTSPSRYAPTRNSLFDEERWLKHLKEDSKRSGQPTGIVAVDDHALPAIFDVPEALLSTKPEAYAPHMFAIGPYHKRRPELYEMERRKANIVGRGKGDYLQGRTCDDLVQHFTALEGKIRAHYHRHLDYNEEEGLAWMMAIDACFVLIFLRKHYSGGEVTTVNGPPEKAWVKNAVLRDILMLENQIPLFLLFEIVKSDELSGTLKTFLREVSPFKLPTGNLPKKPHHLLAILYDAVAPKWEVQPKEPCRVTIEYQHSNATTMTMECQIENEHFNLEDIGDLANSFPTTNPVKFVRILLAAMIKWFTAKYWSRSPPATASLDEFPSATDLHNVGVEFVAIPMGIEGKRGIEGIRFHPRKREFRLPVIYLDDNSAVIMRNLVAYEATAVHGPLTFARDTELMSAVIRTEQDLKLLRESEIIKGELLGNRKALDLWNGMSRSVRATKVPHLDEQIVAVKEFYDNWRVIRARRFIRRSAYEGSWKILLLLAATLLLLMNGLEAYCSVYTCTRRPR